MTLVTWAASISPPLPSLEPSRVQRFLPKPLSVSKFTSGLPAKFKGLCSVCLFDLKDEFDTINHPLLPVLPLALMALSSQVSPLISLTHRSLSPLLAPLLSSSH